MASQFCPPARFSDTTRLAFRMCEENGMWQGRRKNESGNIGWTNYTPCFPPEVIELLEKVKDNTQAMLYIAQITRYIEIVGFTFSFFTLSGSLKVLISNRSLRNTRTKIHINLFVAMLLQIIVRLILYIDQEIVRIYFGGGTTGTGIVNTPILCEVSYTFLEYAITEMFIWMFIEGWYLNSVVTSDVLKSEMAFTVVCSISWVGPFLLTLMWAAATFIHYAKEGAATCWYGYNFLDIYWIVQGPRLAIIIINLTFMLNILRVLVTRMHRDIHNDATRVKIGDHYVCAYCFERAYNRNVTAIEALHTLHLRHLKEVVDAKKGVRAMCLLLPLLGITNVLNMTEAPLDGPTWYFATWSYVTHFFRSFQGTIIAVLYCFLNSEVQAVYIKKFNDWRALRETRRRQGDLRRNGRHPNLISALTQTRCEATQTRIAMRNVHLPPTPTARPRSLAELEISLPVHDENRRSTGTDTGPSILIHSRPSSGSVGQTLATIENEYDSPIAALRNTTFRRSDPALAVYSCNQDIETCL